MNQTLENQLTDRTPLVIAIEINSIKEQTRRMVLANSIEIGRRLVEAKSLIEYGEWGTWLKETVDYSQSTANNLMRIFQEYGEDQLSLFGSDAKSQALGNLSYTQAVALLGIEPEEREQFVEEHDIENMSTRELQQAIKERDQAKEENTTIRELLNNKEQNIQNLNLELDKLTSSLDDEETQRKKLESSVTDLKKQLEEAQSSGDSDEVDRLRSELDKTSEELEASYLTIKDLERQLKEKPIEVQATEVVEKIPEEVEQELHQLRERTRELEAKAQLGEQGKSNEAILKFTFHFENLVKGFKDLLGSLCEIKLSDQEEYEKYKNAVIKLVGKMTENL